MYLTDLKRTYSKYFTMNTEDVTSFLNDIDNSSLTITIGLDTKTINKLNLFLEKSKSPNFDKGIFIHYVMEKYLLKYKLDGEFREETHAKHFCNSPLFEIEEISENYNIKKQNSLADDLMISDSDSDNETEVYTNLYNLKIYGGELIDNLDNQEVILKIFEKINIIAPTKKEIEVSKILTVLESTKDTFNSNPEIANLYSNLISKYNGIINATVPDVDTTTKIENLINRQVIRTYSDKNKCSSCNKSFSCSSSLNRHLREKHKTSNLYTCNTCDKIYKRKDVLQKHVSSCHKNKKFKNFACPYCNHKYGQKFNLNKHIKNHHKCNICNIAYKNKNDLKRHKIRRHDLMNMNNDINKLDKPMDMPSI